MVGEIPILGRLVTMIPRSRLPSMMSAIKVSYPSLICIGGTETERSEGGARGREKDGRHRGFQRPFPRDHGGFERKKGKHESFRHRAITPRGIDAIILAISFDRSIIGSFSSLSSLDWSSMTRGNSSEENHY